MNRPPTQASLLDSLTAAGRDALLRHAVKRRYATGEVLWSAGETSSGITLVVEGKVRVVRGSGGRQTVIHSGETGTTLGEVPFFTRSPYPATAIAAEPTTCLILSHDAVKAAMAVDPGLAFFFLERLSRRVQSLVDRVDQIAVHSVQARLASYVLQRSETVASARPSTGTTDNRPAFSLGMTQTALAEELGTVREVVVRSLRALRTLGAIEGVGDGKYRVADAVLLKRLADSTGGT